MVHRAGRRTLLTRKEKNVSEKHSLSSLGAPTGTAEVCPAAADGSLQGLVEDQQKTSYPSAMDPALIVFHPGLHMAPEEGKPL